MKQGWFDLAYIHFRYDPEAVASILPDGIDVDLHDGSAWVGLIPFSMRGIGIPHLPSIPYLGSFPEVNVRTYVVRDGIPGVWFCSLDINRLLPTLAARTMYQLPYCFGRAHHERVANELYTSVSRRWPRGEAHTDIRIRIGEMIVEPSATEVFLSARWGLYSRTRSGRLRYAPVQHPRWPLQRAELISLDDSLIEAAGLPSPVGDAHVMFSAGVPVRVGRPHSLGPK
ncbi:MAG: DUF2071 domain-containing protein [Ilumatobacteraceae bacterium]|nr:DUF2071 domain-containing protein [Ilumatobacteraceae bacterium]